MHLIEDKKLKLRVATMPHADNFQLHIYAALAEQEREFISIRTKQALQAAKARGTKLGGTRPEAQNRHKAVKDLADANAQRVAELIKTNRDAGKTYQFIADQLNKLKVNTARGGKWYAATCRNYHLRLSL